MLVFKKCNVCLTKWGSRDSFLTDPEIKVIGYQANFKDLHRSLFYFNHKKEGCGTSLAITIDEFLDMYKGDIHPSLLRGLKPCPRHCENVNDLSPCSQECSCAYVRDVLQLIKDYKK